MGLCFAATLDSLEDTPLVLIPSNILGKPGYSKQAKLPTRVYPRVILMVLE